MLTDPEYLHKLEREAVRLKDFNQVLEVGPGKGALTRFLYPLLGERLIAVELDERFPSHLRREFPGLSVIEGDFLQLDIASFLRAPAAIAGNFPYNISTQIVFKILENRDLVTGMLGMFQKEVAERICAGPGSKSYGIQSVMTALYYKRVLLFDIPPTAFTPPPKVDSAVMWMERSPENDPGIPYKEILKVVKAVFNQRRKTVRNSLKGLSGGKETPYDSMRPEQLPPEAFVELADLISS